MKISKVYTMTVTYKGLDCLKDTKNPLYAEYKKISQSGVHAWAYQAKYGYYVMYFGAVLIFIMVLKNIWYRYGDYSYRNTKLGYKHYNIKILNKIAAFSRSISYKRFPLILSRITGLPSSLGTLIVLAVSTLFVLCYCFIPHFWYRGCRGFGSPPISVRSGMMIMGMTPFLIVLSGKTNFISQITGISYEKLNIFHQGLGWGSLFLALVHTIPFYVQPLREGGSAQLRKVYNGDELYMNGIPPLVALVFLCFLSTRFSRKLCYELYLHLHWTIGLAYIGLLTWHVYGELGSEKYIWGTFGFWGFQLIYRALVKTTFKPNAYALKSKEGELSKLPNGNFQVIIPVDSTYEFDWAPGQHIFIRFVYGFSTLDNHPFSILSIPNQDSNYHIKLIVKPHRGLTKKLHDALDNNDVKTKKLRLYIDGPYGGMNRDVLSFDKVVMVSSGSGITVTWPFFEYIISNISLDSNAVQQVDFKWIVKNTESLDWIKQELIQTLNKLAQYDPKLLHFFKFELFVTNSLEISPQIVHNKQEILETSAETSSFSEKSIQESTIDETNLLDYLSIHMNQKPSMTTYLQTTKLLPKTCFIVSGTSSLQNDCGNAVSSLQHQVFTNKSINEIYLHTENFGW